MSTGGLGGATGGTGLPERMGHVNVADRHAKRGHNVARVAPPGRPGRWSGRGRRGLMRRQEGEPVGWVAFRRTAMGSFVCVAVKARSLGTVGRWQAPNTR